MKKKLLIIVILFCGCTNNNICYNRKDNTIESSGSITFVTLSRNGGSSITWDNTELEYARNKINLNRTRIEGYNIKVYGNPLMDDNSLYPNSKYKVAHRSIGDADAGYISFETDSMGNAVKIKGECKIR